MAKNSSSDLTAEENLPAAIEDQRSRRSQWPMLVVLAFMWTALWQDMSLSTLVLGVVFGAAVMMLLPLPPVPFADRLNVYHTITFIFYFLWKITAATWDVAVKAIKPGPKVVNSVVAVKLRTQDDLLLTLVGRSEERRVGKESQARSGMHR